jgi:hypothetical protein
MSLRLKTRFALAGGLVTPRALRETRDAGFESAVWRDEQRLAARAALHAS